MNSEELSRIKIINELTVTIREEDHTLMNVLKWGISNNWYGNEVEFCGYNIPHPSDSLVQLTIQLKDKNIQNESNVLRKIHETLEGLKNYSEKLLSIIPSQ